MPQLKKVKGRYYAIFRASGRSQTSEPLMTTRKEPAERLYREVCEAYAAGRFDPWDPRPYREQIGGVASPTTILEAGRLFLDARDGEIRPPSKRAYDLAVRGLSDRAPAGLPVAAVGPEHVRPYVTDPTVSAATRRHRFGHVRAFLRWCRESGLMAAEADPLRGIRLPREERQLPSFVGERELERILAAVDGSTELNRRAGYTRDGENVWLKDVVVFAAYTGLRLGELAAARWGWVDLDGETITLRHADGFRTKSNRERVVPLVGPALAVVRRRAAEREAQGESLAGHLFLGPRGEPLCPSYTSKRFKHFVRLAKLNDRLHFHSLRHGCASMLVQRGVPLPVVQRVLGHSSISVTEIYSHLQPEHVRASMAAAFPS